MCDTLPLYTSTSHNMQKSSQFSKEVFYVKSTKIITLKLVQATCKGTAWLTVVSHGVIAS